MIPTKENEKTLRIVCFSKRSGKFKSVEGMIRICVCREVTKIIYFIIKYYREYQGFKVNLGGRSKMIIWGHFWPLLKWATFFGVTGAVAKTGLSQKSNRQTKLSLFKIPNTYGSMKRGIRREKLEMILYLILSTTIKFESGFLDFLFEDGDLLPDPFGHLAVLDGHAAARKWTLITTTITRSELRKSLVKK